MPEARIRRRRLARWGGDDHGHRAQRRWRPRGNYERMRQALKDLPAVGSFKVTLSLGVVATR